MTFLTIFALSLRLKEYFCTAFFLRVHGQKPQFLDIEYVLGERSFMCYNVNNVSYG